MCIRDSHGIGNNKGRVLSSPLYFPSRIALMNCSSFQLPVPVASEVRFAANDCPHEPTAVVRSSDNNIQPFFTTAMSVFVIGLLDGYPDKRSSGIISGPFGPILFGE